MSRGRTDGQTIRNPAFAIAAGKCWLARWRGGSASDMLGLRISSFHPGTCTFCEWEPEDLISMMEEFLNWAGLVPNQYFEWEPAPLRPELEGFLMMDAEDQEKTVLFAQGYSDDGD